MNLLTKKQPLVAPPVQEDAHISTRMRLIEEKASNLNKKLELLESNVIHANQKRNQMLRDFDQELLTMKRTVEGMDNKIGLIINELRLLAGKDEINMLKKYLDLWDLTRFVSRHEVERIVDEAMEHHAHKKSTKHTAKK